MSSQGPPYSVLIIKIGLPLRMESMRPKRAALYRIPPCALHNYSTVGRGNVRHKPQRLTGSFTDF